MTRPNLYANEFCKSPKRFLVFITLMFRWPHAIWPLFASDKASISKHPYSINKCLPLRTPPQSPSETNGGGGPGEGGGVTRGGGKGTAADGALICNPLI